MATEQLQHVFGGDWTETKLKILIDYTKAYLVIMNTFAPMYNWRLLYFDGFAGTGAIDPKEGNKDQHQDFIVPALVESVQETKEAIWGSARAILDIDNPRPFDQYFFVELDNKRCAELEKLKDEYPQRSIEVINADCNDILKQFAVFLESRVGRSCRTLAFLDPYGMELDWNSLIALKEKRIDAWILVPTGMGVNRHLRKDANISDAEYERLERFLGLTRDEITKRFYEKPMFPSLFGGDEVLSKVDHTIEKVAELYSGRLSELFQFVSQPYILRNSKNSVMYHFFLVSMNKTACKIANDLVGTARYKK